MRLLFVLVGLAFAGARAEARPLLWNEINEGDALALNQGLNLGTAQFADGTAFTVITREALSAPGMSLNLFTLHETACGHPEWETELQVVLPRGETDATRSVGVQIKAGCEWEIYVETKDLQAASLFREQ